MTPDSPLTPDSRRNFVKKSLAASILAAQPTILAGLIRAEGGGGGTGTTSPWDTTSGSISPETTTPETTVESTNYWETTEPWETTYPHTTQSETLPPNKAMLCSAPANYAQQKPETIAVGAETLSLLLTSVTRKADPPGTDPYNSDSAVWVLSVSVYQGTSNRFSDSQTRNFDFVCDPTSGAISSTEPTPPPTVAQWGLSIAFATSFTTIAGVVVTIVMESEIGGGGSRDITLYQKVRISYPVEGEGFALTKDNDKNLTYVNA